MRGWRRRGRREWDKSEGVGCGLGVKRDKEIDVCDSGFEDQEGGVLGASNNVWAMRA